MNTTDKAMATRHALTRFIAAMREDGHDVVVNDAMNLMQSMCRTGKSVEVLATLWNAMEDEKAIAG